MSDEREPVFQKVFADPKRAVCTGLATVITASAVGFYHYDPACHGGWGACREAHHLEHGSTATGQVSGIDHWNSHG